MKWLMVVIFATAAGDVYIFKKPTFESLEACIESVKDPEAQKQYVAKLVMEYGRVMPIHGINCLDEQTIKDILEEHDIPYEPKVRYNKT
jgi:hypothetical protein